MKELSMTKKLTTIGVMAALSVILVALVHFPILPGAAFLEYDPADIPIFLCTFLLGPLCGFILTVVVSIVQGFTVSASGGIIGVIMHIFATGAFVWTAGLIYKHNRTKKSAVIALIAGILVMTATMCLWNVIFTPIYMGTPRKAIIAMLPTAIIPFNLLKSGINSAVTFLLYKKLSNIVFRNNKAQSK